MIYKIAPATYTLPTHGFQEFRPKVQKVKYLVAAAGSNPPDPPNDNNTKIFSKALIEKIKKIIGNKNNISNDNTYLHLNQNRYFN